MAGLLHCIPTMAASARHVEQRYFRDISMVVCEITEMAP